MIRHFLALVLLVAAHTSAAASPYFFSWQHDFGDGAAPEWLESEDYVVTPPADPDQSFIMFVTHAGTTGLGFHDGTGADDTPVARMGFQCCTDPSTVDFQVTTSALPDRPYGALTVFFIPYSGPMWTYTVTEPGVFTAPVTDGNWLLTLVSGTDVRLDHVVIEGMCGIQVANERLPWSGLKAMFR